MKKSKGLVAPAKPIEIFSGTGGVGKTTLSTSRALALAKANYKVLLITIDPAKRLKQVLQIKSKDEGTVCTIPCSRFEKTEVSESESSFDALLLSPYRALNRMSSNKQKKNNILEILSSPHGSLNEITAILELEHYFSSDEYDTIILDTPPGKHFIDFLKASHKITQFFDKNIVNIFKHLTAPKKGLFSTIVSGSVNKLLGYLEKVTGPTFVGEFIETISLFFNNKEAFLRCLDFQEKLKEKKFSNWFLVSSTEQQKITETAELHAKAGKILHKDNYFIINKCLNKHLKDWKTSKSPANLKSLKKSLLSKEENIKQFAHDNFHQIIEFPEVLEASPADHVAELANFWKK